ncbi:DUF4055 domain-containing protein [Vreelandella andesensis]|uniref:DUF4055 domain-containing protein n=1 Tax=Vreelandella andesensis TaxID=447567 RepID=A0A433KF87_9GAMM|nr:DUF4055 domain-containing protein [Halomonas andesensis]RUR26835.1 DUF4055 domain-containing protein [Halomonas andesensis]
MPADTLHPLYLAHEDRASRVRDAVAGTDAIKGKGERYLPNPSGKISALPEREREQAQARYDAYKNRAFWLGVTGRTHEGLVGAVFRKAPTVELPSVIEYMRDDADGSGLALEQFARLITSSLMKSGRHGVLVDYPEAEDGLTREQTAGLKATLRSYDSESIINWRREGEALTLVVLREVYEKEVDQFERDREFQYRVLSLEDGRYVQTVYRDNKEVPAARIEPRMANGQAWPVIPFIFVGAVANDETPDKPVLLDLADANIAHYQSSADRREGSHTVGQPMLVIDIGDMSTHEFQEANPAGVLYGSRFGLQVKGGKAELLQAQPHDMARQDMLDAREDMKAIGARLIDSKGGNETAEGVRERSGAEHSALASVAVNVGDALEKALEYAAQFMTAADVFEQILIALNQEFYPEGTDPQMVMARIAELDRGLIADTDYWQWARKHGLIDSDRDDESLRADVQAGGTNLNAI